MENFHFKLAEKLVKFLDDGFELFGFRFGLEPIIGLIPGIGDIIGFVIGFYIIWVGKRMGVSNQNQKRMFVNLLIDLVISLIPIVGDVGDFFFKSNRMNLNIIKKYRTRLNTDVEEGEIIG